MIDLRVIHSLDKTGNPDRVTLLSGNCALKKEVKVKRPITVFWFMALAFLMAGNIYSTSTRILNFEISVREKPAGEETSYTLIDKRMIAIYEDVKTNMFITNFTLDLKATYNDSGYFVCDFSLYTLGPQTQTFFKKFQSQPGGVYFLEQVKAKAGSVYRVAISPLSVDSVGEDISSCDFSFREDGIWRFDPSANFSFYFIPLSLADARWNMLRDYMEDNYREFRELAQLRFPGKVNCFLSPCALPEVIWDKRMGFAIDPARANCFVIYSHEHNTVDPIASSLLRLYKFDGYAPPMLVEGKAAYFEFPHFYAMELKASDQLPSLEVMLKSIDYYRLPEMTNISAASSFAKFIIDRYTPERFNDLYKRSTDLNIKEMFNEVYGKPLDVLEQEWHAALDTIDYDYGIFHLYYEREHYIQRRSNMKIYLDQMRQKMKTFSDSNLYFTEHGWLEYSEGNYDNARSEYETLLGLSPNSTTYMTIFSNMLMLDGQYDSARTMYNRLLLVDTTAKTSLYKIGESFYLQNRWDSAEVYFLRDIEEDPSQLSMSSSAIYLGQMALANKDTTKASDYFSRSLELMTQVFQFGSTRPSFLYRLGQTHLGLAICGESTTDKAQSFYEQALYFEVHPTRVISAVRILRDLGRIADFDGNREAALDYYQQAQEFPMSSYLKTQLDQYLVSPFTGF